MQKIELIKAVAAKSEAKQTVVEAVLKAFTEVTLEAVKTNDKVQLPGFGSFSKKEVAARDYKSPLDGKVVHKEASVSLKFKVAEKAKEALNAK